MEHSPYPIISATVAKTPEWLRIELASKDATARLRAEEALAAIIADALASADTSEVP